MSNKKKENLSNIFDVLNAKYKGALYRASEYKFAEIKRIPTGNFYLDIAMGGGPPIGRTTLLYGHKSSGKSHVAMCTVSSAQRRCRFCYKPLEANKDEEKCCCKKQEAMRCVYCDIEGTWSNEWAKSVGINLNELYLSRPETAEQAIDIIELLLKSGEVDLIVLDSVAFMTPAAEIEKEIYDWQQGLHARLMGKAIRRWTSALNTASKKFDRLPTMILTNQIRYKIGIVYGNPETLPGGMAVGFATSIEVKFWATKSGVKVDKSSGKPLWVTINYDVSKNKVSAAHRSGEFRLVISDLEHHRPGQCYDEDELMRDLLRFEIIQKEGKEYKFLDKKFRVQDDIVTFLLTDKEGRRKSEEILKEVLSKL